MIYQIVGVVVFILAAQAYAIFHFYGKVQTLKAERLQYETVAIQCAESVRKLRDESEVKRRAFARVQRELALKRAEADALAASILSGRELPGEPACVYVERQLDEEIDLRGVAD